MDKCHHCGEYIPPDPDGCICRDGAGYQYCSMKCMMYEKYKQVNIGPYTVTYENDVGPGDEGFWEWFEVKHDGWTLCKCDRREDALRIAIALSAQGGK
jgi:hypothetical protein